MSNTETKATEVMGETPDYEPPRVFDMQYCTHCGRNDLRLPLSDNHYASGKRCHGEIKTVVYNRIEL